jgi:hypothetical protein
MHQGRRAYTNCTSASANSTSDAADSARAAEGKDMVKLSWTNIHMLLLQPSNIGPNPSKPSSSSESSNPTYHSPDKKSSHWFRNLMIVGFIAGIGYFLYKRQADGFNFVRYRRMAPFGQRSTFHEGDMYSGLSLEGSTFFEPPTLPPTPMSMPNNGGYGA